MKVRKHFAQCYGGSIARCSYSSKLLSEFQRSVDELISNAL
jgi:hypothetical protein